MSIIFIGLIVQYGRCSTNGERCLTADGHWCCRDKSIGTDLPSVLSVLDQATRGVEDLHAAGIIHGDVKATNMLVFPGGRIKISDLGSARPIDHRSTLFS